MGKDWGKWGRRFDSVGARVLLFGFFLLIAFVIVQPLVWRLWLKEPGPVEAQSLASLVSILVTILSIAIAGFGVMAFKLAMGLIGQQLAVRSQRIEDDLHKRLTPRVDYALLKITLLNSVRTWQEYERVWSSRGYPEPVRNEPEVGELVAQALDETTYALRLAEKLPAESDYDPPRIASKNSVAYHLATRKEPADKERALSLVRELRSAAETSHHIRETVAWVCLRFGEPGDQNWEEGTALVQALVSDRSLPDAWRGRLRTKYEQVFGLELRPVSGPIQT